MGETRALPVPDGLEGERIDTAVARLLGLSRSRVAEIAADGAITLDHRTVGKSDTSRQGSGWRSNFPTVSGRGSRR